MASYPIAEDEKRLLAHAAETTTTDADTQTKCHRSCRRRAAGLKRAVGFTLTLMFVIVCSMAALGLTSLAIGTIRHAPSCSKHGAMTGKGGSAASAKFVPKPADAADTNVPTSSVLTFTGLLEAVSPESLHDLLHEYFPDTYKHGVYPSEKSALEAIHRKNAALATSIAQLARRELNTTTTANSSSSQASVTSSAPVSTDATSSSDAETKTTTSGKASETKDGTTTSHSTKTSTSTGQKVTSVYTSTINGSPTVVTATSIVGVGAANTGGTATATGSLQTGAAVPVLSGNNAHFAKAVAGVIVGAMLI